MGAAKAMPVPQPERSLLRTRTLWSPPSTWMQSSQESRMVLFSTMVSRSKVPWAEPSSSPPMPSQPPMMVLPAM